MTLLVGYLLIATAVYMVLPEEPPDLEFHPIHWYSACLIYALLWPLSLSVLLIGWVMRLISNT